MNDSTLDLGGITITWLDGGTFELDGGTMFGAVPKLLWSRQYPVDQNNYIKMLAAPLLVKTPETAVIIDTGLGNKLTEKQKQIFRVKKMWDLPEALGRHGISRRDIGCVILTHCDFDHAGGILMNDPSGNPEITFPEAMHIVHEAEWQDARHPGRRSAYTYFPENFRGLAESGKLQLTQGDHTVIPGVAVHHTGGHTRGHQMVKIQGQLGCAFHLGDLMPTHAHANPLWIMAYDNFPLDVIGQKEQIIAQARNGNCWFTFYHDAYIKACRLDENGQIADQISGDPTWADPLAPHDHTNP